MHSVTCVCVSGWGGGGGWRRGWVRVRACACACALDHRRHTHFTRPHLGDVGVQKVAPVLHQLARLVGCGGTGMWCSGAHVSAAAPPLVSRPSPRSVERTPVRLACVGAGGCGSMGGRGGRGSRPTTSRSPGPPRPPLTQQPAARASLLAQGRGSGCQQQQQGDGAQSARGHRSVLGASRGGRCGGQTASAWQGGAGGRAWARCRSEGANEERGEKGGS